MQTARLSDSLVWIEVLSALFIPADFAGGLPRSSLRSMRSLPNRRKVTFFGGCLHPGGRFVRYFHNDLHKGVPDESAEEKV